MTWAAPTPWRCVCGGWKDVPETGCTARRLASATLGLRAAPPRPHAYRRERCPDRELTARPVHLFFEDRSRKWTCRAEALRVGGGCLQRRLFAAGSAGWGSGLFSLTPPGRDVTRLRRTLPRSPGAEGIGSLHGLPRTPASGASGGMLHAAPVRGLRPLRAPWGLVRSGAT